MVTSQVGSPDSRPASMRAAARCGLRRSVERPSRDAGLRTLGCEFDDLGCGTISIYTSDTQGALVDGRSRRADGFCGIETLCQCISDALCIMRHFRDNTVCRMSDRPHVVARSLGQSSEIRLAPTRPGYDNHASSAIGRLPGADPLAQCVGPRCASTSALRLIGGGVGVEGNGEALSA